MSAFKIGPAIPQLPSGDIQKTADFFESKLGFQVTVKDLEAKFLIVKRENAEIHFWQTETESQAYELGCASSCYIRVENVQAIFEDLKQRKTIFKYEPTHQPWGMNEMQINDPYENAIKFGERITSAPSN